MKFTPVNITGLLLLVGMTGVLTIAKAQENRPFPEPELTVKDTKIENTTFSEAEPSSIVKSQRDSVQVIVKPVSRPVKAGEKSSKDKQEDPLSFNFLYYIIEKFKLSDIIE